MLAATMRGALENRYGPDGYQEIRTALDGLGDVSETLVVALDDSEDMDSFGLPTVLGPDPGSILSSLRQIRKKLGKVATMLVGGDEIIPYWRFANPVADRDIDADDLVLTDNPYGTSADEPEE